MFQRCDYTFRQGHLLTCKSHLRNRFAILANCKIMEQKVIIKFSLNYWKMIKNETTVYCGTKRVTIIIINIILKRVTIIKMRSVWNVYYAYSCGRLNSYEDRSKMLELNNISQKEAAEIQSSALVNLLLCIFSLQGKEICL